MKLVVHRRSVKLGGRLAHALAGLAARGHVVVDGDRGPGEAARLDADVVVGGGRPLGPAWLAALTRARALVLELDAATHRRWNPLERWAWSIAGGYGIIDEGEVDEFLAQAPAWERERVALWAAAPAGDEAIAASLAGDTQLLERVCERALARRAAGPERSALFLDRDGTLIAERHHLADPGGVELLPGVASALRSARALGHPLIVISNQAGVGRGLFPETQVHAVMARMRELLRAEGVELDAVRHCPHAPDAGCDCRKPAPRLLREAAEDLRVSVRDSLTIGDKWIDVEAGKAAGTRAALVRTGHGAVEQGLPRGDGAPRADVICDDLPAAVRWFLADAHDQ